MNASWSYDGFAIRDEVQVTSARGRNQVARTHKARTREVHIRAARSFGERSHGAHGPAVDNRGHTAIPRRRHVVQGVFAQDYCLCGHHCDPRAPHDHHGFRDHDRGQSAFAFRRNEHARKDTHRDCDTSKNTDMVFERHNLGNMDQGLIHCLTMCNVSFENVFQTFLLLLM